MMAESRPSAIVLAGGRSSRFGSDKAKVEFRGVTLLEHVLRACAPLCDELIVVAATEQQLDPSYAQPAVRLVRDEVAFEGPLAGLLAGLPRISSRWAIVCSVDTPLLAAGVLRLLIHSATADVLAVLPVVEGRVQPFPSLVAKDSLAALRAAFDAGERRIGAALQGLAHVEVPELELRAEDPRLLSFRGANTPQELAELLAETD